MMIKKIFALLLTFMLATNFLSVSAKTAEERAAEKKANKEFRLQQKREKELAKIARRTNILHVEKWANNGDVQAQMILAYAYATGQRVGKNKKLVVELHTKVGATNADLLENFIPLEFVGKKITLPRLYGLAACRSQIGQYVPQNFDDALRWANLGASEFDNLSFAIIGSAYYTGRGYRQYYKKAIEFLKKAGDEPIALNLLSDAYAKGNGVDQDLELSKFYADYSQLIAQPKIDKKIQKNQEKIDKTREKSQEKIDKERKKNQEKLDKQREKIPDQKKSNDDKESAENKKSDETSADNQKSADDKTSDKNSEEK